MSMSSLFQVCQGTCLCAPSPEGYGKGKVLYCYGEVVLQRANLRPGEEEKETNQDVYHLQMAQLVAVAVLLAAVLIVLITIRRGISKLQKQIKKIIHIMSMSPPPSRQNTLEKPHAEKLNGNCVKFEREAVKGGRHEKEEVRSHYFPPLDNMSVNSETA